MTQIHITNVLIHFREPRKQRLPVFDQTRLAASANYLPNCTNDRCTLEAAFGGSPGRTADMGRQLPSMASACLRLEVAADLACGSLPGACRQSAASKIPASLADPAGTSALPALRSARQHAAVSWPVPALPGLGLDGEPACVASCAFPLVCVPAVGRLGRTLPVLRGSVGVVPPPPTAKK